MNGTQQQPGMIVSVLVIMMIMMIVVENFNDDDGFDDEDGDVISDIYDFDDCDEKGGSGKREINIRMFMDPSTLRYI